MERKIGETFVYEGKKLQVKEIERVSCYGCFFDEQCVPLCKCKEVAGECEFENRADNKEVIFVEATEQNQTEQPQELNLCEILKDCPNGELFWSPMLDGVKFSDIDDERQMIIVETVEGHFTWEINADGTISIDEVTSPEIMLYPSREQRDWTKVKYEPSYRPFKTQEECWEEMLKHQPFGWVRSNKCKALLWNVTSINKDDITIICDYYKFHRAFECFEFTDGTPFGIREE